MSDIDMEPERPSALPGKPAPAWGEGHPTMHRHPRREMSESGLNPFDYTQLAAAMAHINDENDRAESPVVAVMHVWKVLGVAGIMGIVSAVGGGFATWYGLKDEMKDMGVHIAQNTADIRSIVDDREKYRTKYLPKVEAGEKANEIQQGQISALVTSVQQLRDVSMSQGKSISETHEDVAVLRNLFAMKFGIPGGPGGSGR